MKCHQTHSSQLFQFCSEQIGEKTDKLAIDSTKENCELQTPSFEEKTPINEKVPSSKLPISSPVKEEAVVSEEQNYDYLEPQDSLSAVLKDEAHPTKSKQDSVVYENEKMSPSHMREFHAYENKACKNLEGEHEYTALNDTNTAQNAYLTLI